jgi:putative signal transducing protein
MAEPVNLGSNAQQRPDPDEKLVKVFGSEQESEAMVVKGLLDTAGIDSDLTSAAFLQDMFPGLGGMIILVREEDADQARRLIAEQRQTSVAEDDETAEIEAYQDPVSGEPPPKA